MFTVHTNAIVVTIRISIGDLIVGVGAATKMFTPAANTLAPALLLTPENPCLWCCYQNKAAVGYI